MPSPLTTSDIQAAPGATPAPPTPTPEPPAPDAPEENKGPTDYTGPGAGGSHPAAMLETLPEDLLQNPLIFAVAKGNPAAVSAPDKSKDPAVLAVVKHAQPLVAAGFGIYQSVDKKTDVLFNTQSMHPDDLLQADRAGKLLDLAPPFDSIKGPATTAAPVATPPHRLSGGVAPALPHRGERSRSAWTTAAAAAG